MKKETLNDKVASRIRAVMGVILPSISRILPKGGAR